MKSTSMLKLVKCIIFALLCNSKAVSAQKCQISPKLMQDLKNTKYFIGVMVRNKKGLHLRLGKYLTGKHEKIFESFSREFKGADNRLVWAGEIKVDVADGLITVNRVNETSGFAHFKTNGLGLEKSLDSVRYFLEEHQCFIIEKRTSFEPYSENQVHLSNELDSYSKKFTAGENLRHHIGNKISVVTSIERILRRSYTKGVFDIHKIMPSLLLMKEDLEFMVFFSEMIKNHDNLNVKNVANIHVLLEKMEQKSTVEKDLLISIAQAKDHFIQIINYDKAYHDCFLSRSKFTLPNGFL